MAAVAPGMHAQSDDELVRQVLAGKVGAYEPLVRLRGRLPEQWRDESLAACRTTSLQWKHWWQANRDRYPGAASTVPANRSDMSKT